MGASNQYRVEWRDKGLIRTAFTDSPWAAVDLYNALNVQKMDVVEVWQRNPETGEWEWPSTQFWLEYTK